MNTIFKEKIIINFSLSCLLNELTDLIINHHKINALHDYLVKIIIKNLIN